jgi:hypothetical protein
MGNDLFLVVHYSVFTVSPTVAFTYKDVLRLGAGPAVFVARSGRDNGGTLDNVTTATKIGAVLDLGISIPMASSFSADLGFQYRFVGTADIGPFEAKPGDPSTTLPVSSVRYDHILISVGIGVGL